MLNLLLTIIICNLELVALLIAWALAGGRLRRWWAARHPAALKARAGLGEVVQLMIQVHERLVRVGQASSDPARRATCRQAIEALRQAAEHLVTGQAEALVEANLATLACVEALTLHEETADADVR